MTMQSDTRHQKRKLWKISSKWTRKMKVFRNTRPPCWAAILPISSLHVFDFTDAFIDLKFDLVPNDTRNVIVQKLAICPAGRPEIEIDLMGDVSNLTKSPIVIKEGTKYNVKIYFFIQRELVSGLRYLMASYRMKVRGLS